VKPTNLLLTSDNDTIGDHILRPIQQDLDLDEAKLAADGHELRNG
jgi:hypothetical protein